MKEEIQQVLIDFEDDNIGLPIAVEKLLSLFQSKVEEIIGEDEWEDPDIRGNKPEDYKDGSPADGVVTPWIRNWVKREQRNRLKEML